MGQQLETGTQFPMRPSTVAFEVAAGFSVLGNTSTIGTATNQRLDPEIGFSQMNDGAFGPAITLADVNTILLLPGIYRVDFTPACDVSGAVTLGVGIANGDGTVIHVARNTLTVAVDAIYCPTLTALLHIEKSASLVNRQVTFRAGASSGASVMILAGSMGLITKIGNANET